MAWPPATRPARSDARPVAASAEPDTVHVFGQAPRAPCLSRRRFHIPCAPRSANPLIVQPVRPLLLSAIRTACSRVASCDSFAAPCGSLCCVSLPATRLTASCDRCAGCRFLRLGQPLHAAPLLCVASCDFARLLHATLDRASHPATDRAASCGLFRPPPLLHLSFIPLGWGASPEPQGLRTPAASVAGSCRGPGAAPACG